MDFWVMISIIAAIAGSTYAIPQAYRTIKYHSALGISRYFLIFWLIDKAFTLAFMCHLGNVPMILKYSIGTVCIMIIFYYKFFGDKHDR